jgi:hypothetical protein
MRLREEQMRYLIALAVAGLLVGGISLWAHQAGNAVRQRMHQRLVDAQKAGQIPPDVDLNNGDFTDFGTELPTSEKQLIGLLDAWFTFRVILIPILIVGCLAVAALLRSKQPSSKANSDRETMGPTSAST